MPDWAYHPLIVAAGIWAVVLPWLALVRWLERR